MQPYTNILMVFKSVQNPYMLVYIHVNVGELRQAGGGTTDLDGKSCAIHLVADYKY